MNQLESQIASKLDALHLTNETSRGGDRDQEDQLERKIATQSPDHPEEALKDELFDSSGAMEATPLADSNFVTEEPEPSSGAEEKVNATAPSVEEHPIPVFSEWAKQMEKAEKKQEQDVANASTNKHKPADRQRISAPKIRAKNYASPDCGAKIIAANQESDNTGHVLSSSKDEYLISICTSRIWFVVELCEPIQAEKVELANFELFSSSPKEFSVSVSNRYPTRDWSEVGQFVAKDERTIQNFELNPKLFGKFVRVDIHSHYNTEHFCPVSLFRVQGTSEFEAFETADQKLPLDDYDDDEEATEKESKQDNNLFKSASDAVLSIVKKAAQVLTKGEEKNGGGTDGKVKQGENSSSCLTLATVVACPGCKESLAREVSHLLTCQNERLEKLCRWHLVQEMVYKTELCAELLEVQLMRQSERPESTRDMRRDFVAHLFPESYLIAMCNVAAGQEKRLQRITRHETEERVAKQQAEENERKMSETVVNNLTIDGPGLMEMIPKNVETPLKKSQDEHQQQQLIFDPRQEGQGKSCEKEIVENEVPVVVEEEKQQQQQQQEVKSNENVSPTSAPEPSELPTQVDRPPDGIVEENRSNGGGVEEVPVMIPKDTQTQQQPQVPAFGDSWRSSSNNNNNNNGENGLEEGGNLVQKVHGESVFLRLSNRIKVSLFATGGA